MRFRIPLLASLVAIIAIAILAVALYPAGPASAQTPTTQELQTDVDTLNALVRLSYVNWADRYHNLRRADIYQRMDWSQDECSAPLAGGGFSGHFLKSCLRHDMMWRSLAAIDDATGRVWNERNRYKADRQLRADTDGVCLELAKDPWNRDIIVDCTVASRLFYEGVHRYSVRQAMVEEAELLDDQSRGGAGGRGGCRASQCCTSRTGLRRR